MSNLIAPNGQSIMLYDSNTLTAPGVPTTLINSYSVLTIPAFWRALNFLSHNLASFPRAVHKDGAGMDVAHPLDGILKRRPNTYQNQWSFWTTLFFQTAHSANGYALIMRGPNMRPISLRNTIAGNVMPFRIIPEDGSDPMQWYYLCKEKELVNGADMIHFAGLGVDGQVGADPIGLHADTFLRAKTLDKYTTRFLMKGTVIKGAIEVPGDLTDDQLKDLRLRLRTNFRGPEAEDDVLLLTSGAKLNNETLSPQESQLVEQATYSTKQIAQITGVHPWYLYDDRDGRYNGNPEQAGIDVVKYTFRPWIEMAEDELSVKLLTTAEQQQGFRIRMDPAAILRGDSTTITNTLVQQTNAGLRTPNEARKVLELPPDPAAKSDTLRLLGDTTVNMKPAPPAKSAAARTGATFIATTPGQWEALDADCIDLIGQCQGEEPTAFSLQVHQSGAVGRAVAAQYLPPGTTIATNTAAGQHAFTVGDHAGHAHPNWVVPALKQTAGPPMPGNPNPITLANVASMAAGSRVMGHEPTVTVTPPTTAPVALDAGYAALRPVIEATCERIETKTGKAFENAKGKTGQERTVWANVFAEQQARYVAEAFAPINAALVELKAATLIDTAKLGERYAAQLRLRATGKESKTLSAIAKTRIGVGDHEVED